MSDQGDRENPKKEHEKPHEQLSELLQNIFNEPPASGSSTPPKQISPKTKSFRISVCRTGSSRAGVYRCPTFHTGLVRPGPVRSNHQSHAGSGRPGLARPGGAGRPGPARNSGTSRPGAPYCSPLRSKTYQVIESSKDNDTLIFAGRYMTRVERTNPLEVSKRFVGPHLKSDTNACPDAERLVRKLFGVRNLTNVLLLITPSFEKQKDKHILHGYVIHGKRHLGVTSLTTADKELIERSQKSGKYSIMYCSTYLELKDAYNNEEIKEKIFKTLSTQSSVPVCSFFKDRMLTLRYRGIAVQKKTCKPLCRVASDNSVMKTTASVSLKPTRCISVSSICLRTTQHSSQLTVSLYDQPTGENNKLNVDTTEESKGDCSKMEVPMLVASKPKEQVDYKTKIKQWREKVEKNKLNKLLKNENQEQAKLIKAVDKIDPKARHLKRENRINLPNKRQEVFSRNEDKNVKKFSVRKTASKRVLKREEHNEYTKRNAAINSQPKNYLANKYNTRKVLPKPDELKRENIKVSQPKRIHVKNPQGPKPISEESRHDETITASPKKTDLETRNLMQQRKMTSMQDSYKNEPNLLENKSFDQKIRDVQLDKALREEYKKQTSDVFHNHSMHMEGLPSNMETMKLSHKMREQSIDTCQMEHEELQDELKKTSVKIEIDSNALEAINENKLPARSEPEESIPKITVFKATLTKLKRPRVRHSESSLRSRTSTLPTNFKRRVYERFGRWRDEFRVVVGAHRLRESKGAIHMPVISDQPRVKFHTTWSIIEAKSVVFERLMEPVKLPKHFSKEACEHFRSRLVQIEAKQTFFKFDKLMRKINKCPVPRYRHLMTFFKFVMLLDIKLFVREEICWPGYAPATEPRYQIECYVFDDRKDFLVSLGLLCRQLKEFAELYPSIKRNLRYIDDALDLIVVPTVVTRCLRAVMTTLHSRRLLQFLAEVTFDFIQPLPTPLNEHDDEQENEEDKCVVYQVQRMEQALKSVKQSYAQTE